MRKSEYTDIMNSLDEIRGELRSLSLFAAQSLLRTSLMLPEPQVFVQSALLNIGSNLITMNNEVPEGNRNGTGRESPNAMSDDAPQRILWEHWCEQPGCKAWGSLGYETAPGLSKWFCFEHKRERGDVFGDLRADYAPRWGILGRG